MIRNAVLSPTGVRAAFEARGEIFTVPAEKGDFRNLTQSSGAHDRNPAWSPDGAQLAWLSDASGEYQLMIGEPMGAHAGKGDIALPSTAFFSDPDVVAGRVRRFCSRTITATYGRSKRRSGTAEKIDTDKYPDPSSRFRRLMVAGFEVDHLFKESSQPSSGDLCLFARRQESASGNGRPRGLDLARPSMREASICTSCRARISGRAPVGWR